MVPANEFWKRLRENKFVNEPMKFNGPVRLFTLKSRSYKDTKFEKEEGTAEV